jgi:arylsulfatase A-like enzyme
LRDLGLSEKKIRRQEGNQTAVHKIFVSCFQIGFIPILLAVVSRGVAVASPNVILIITDDQGYGDIAAHGNPVLKTPHLDRLYGESVRCVDFHVDPTCSPTRAALLSGRYSTRTGVWHTIAGRSLMHPDELTLAEIFRHNRYRTAMFGKWHLGDTPPMRPHEQGFDEAVYHGGGGVGQTPDVWGNDYFDDTYFRNGQPEAFEGYCTDVWFREAIRFMDRNGDRPFFVYLATNAPHSPYLVSDEYAKPYAKLGSPTDRFLGMIANIDENIGRLLAYLDRKQLANDTIVIFMTDNGTAQGEAVYDAGMRGKKGSEYDGGHRVPCFWRYPARGIGGKGGGRDLHELTAHIDVRPTLVELCELTEPEGPATDGISLESALRDVSAAVSAPSDRILFVHSQRVLEPEKWRQSAVLTRRWRLINGRELYDITRDRNQQQELSEQYPRIVRDLRQAYEQWWESLAEARSQTVSTRLDAASPEQVCLTAHDWLDPSPPWHQGHIRQGPRRHGAWSVQTDTEGDYTVILTRWPREIQQAIESEQAELQVGEQVYRLDLASEANEATFQVRLPRGVFQLSGRFMDGDGQMRGAYYAYVTRVETTPQDN